MVPYSWVGHTKEHNSDFKGADDLTSHMVLRKKPWSFIVILSYYHIFWMWNRGCNVHSCRESRDHELTQQKIENWTTEPFIVYIDLS